MFKFCISTQRWRVPRLKYSYLVWEKKVLGQPCKKTWPINMNILKWIGLNIYARQSSIMKIFRTAHFWVFMSVLVFWSSLPKYTSNCVKTGSLSVVKDILLPVASDWLIMYLGTTSSDLLTAAWQWECLENGYACVVVNECDWEVRYHMAMKSSGLTSRWKSHPSSSERHRALRLMEKEFLID